MNRAPTYGPIPLALTMLVALFSALVALAVTGGHDAGAHGSGDDHATVASAAVPTSPIVTEKELALRNDMRRLWEDHVTWTRLAIISLTTDAPDTEATVGRLLQNQTDIGDVVKPFYGEAAGEELTRLLRDHTLIAADLVAAAKAGDQAAAEAQSRWTANADETAAFLASANQRSWKLDQTTAMLREHLRLTTNEALTRLRGDWAADVAAYDEIHVHALGMADVLSTGIVEQFPTRFR
jgi:hypothetical protein